MTKLLAIYKKPLDIAAFDRHYQEVHLPLVQKIPGLSRCELHKVTGGPFGSSEYYQICEMFFENQEAATSALNSKEGREAGKDLMGFAKGLVTLLFAQLEEEVRSKGP